MYQFINKALNRFNSKSSIIVETPVILHIGNCAEEIFFGLLKARREGKKVLFLFLLHPLFWKFSIPISNRELLRLESAQTVPNNSWYGHLLGWILTVVYSLLRVNNLIWCSVKIRRTISLIKPSTQIIAPKNEYERFPSIGRSALWQPEGAVHFSWAIVAGLNWRNQFKEFQPPRLNEKKYAIAERMRVKMGIPLGEWFACLHVRETGNLKDSANRDAKIENHIEGIQAITSAGGWVVRLGGPSMTPLPQLDRVIDYPHTLFKSELMDMYLLNQCRFFVGNNSGPYDVAILFRKPTILINASDWSHSFPVNMGDLAITKHIFARSRNRFLSIKEMLDEPVDCQDAGGQSEEYYKVENTPEEIRGVIEEYLAQPSNFEHSDLQISFNEKRREQVHRWLDRDEINWSAKPKEEVIVQQYRIASRSDSVAGTLGQKYLEQNWTADNLANSPTRPLVS